MKKIVRKTGDYGIGIMIHSVHMTDDVPALNRFYEDVFSGLMYMGVDEPNFLPVEDRWAGLLLVSDLCIETMAPSMPADPTKPVGKFYTKFGRHLHSVGYKVDDLGRSRQPPDRAGRLHRRSGRRQAGPHRGIDDVLLPEPAGHVRPHGRALQGGHAERPAAASTSRAGAT